MKIHEYQAKAILSEFGIPVPRGEVASTPAEARQIAEKLGVGVVIKAQVHAGGRGKAGGIKMASSPAEAERAAAQVLGMRLVTHQTGPQGVPVSKVLVAEAIEVKQELYLGIVVDSGAKQPVIMASDAGGVEIEEVAARTPEKIYRAYVDPIIGLRSYQSRTLSYRMGLQGDLVRSGADIISNLHRAFQAKDCSLAEVNPLVITTANKLLALDAKLNLEDDALFRHPELVKLRDPEQEEPLEVQATNADVSYVKLDGDVGCMVNGAGLAMATLDIIKLHGAMPANFLDVGGGANEDQVASAFKIILSDPKVKRVLVNLFGGILRCDVAARGIVQAVKEKSINVPLVVRMLGTNAAEGKDILAKSGLKVVLADDLEEAARKVVGAR